MLRRRFITCLIWGSSGGSGGSSGLVGGNRWANFSAKIKTFATAIFREGSSLKLDNKGFILATSEFSHLSTAPADVLNVDECIILAVSKFPDLIAAPATTLNLHDIIIIAIVKFPDLSAVPAFVLNIANEANSLYGIAELGIYKTKTVEISDLVIGSVYREDNIISCLSELLHIHRITGYSCHRVKGLSALVEALSIVARPALSQQCEFISATSIPVKYTRPTKQDNNAPLTPTPGETILGDNTVIMGASCPLTQTYSVSMPGYKKLSTENVVNVKYWIEPILKNDVLTIKSVYNSTITNKRIEVE